MSETGVKELPTGSGSGLSEDWEARYAVLSQTPVGGREARLRWELRQRAAVPADSEGMGEVSGAERIRLVYTWQRRRWERLRTGAESHYVPSPRWRLVWERAAELCRESGLSAEDLVGALFQTFQDERYLQPNSLLAEKVREAALARSSRSAGRYALIGLSSVSERCHTALAELHRRIRWLSLFAAKPMSGLEALRLAALEQKDGLYALPAYCLVAVYGVWDACEALRHSAFLRWLAEPRGYTAVLGTLCPPEWRLIDSTRDREGVWTEHPRTAQPVEPA